MCGLQACEPSRHTGYHHKICEMYRRPSSSFRRNSGDIDGYVQDSYASRRTPCRFTVRLLTTLRSRVVRQVPRPHHGRWNRKHTFVSTPINYTCIVVQCRIERYGLQRGSNTISMCTSRSPEVSEIIPYRRNVTNQHVSVVVASPICKLQHNDRSMPSAPA